MRQTLWAAPLEGTPAAANPLVLWLPKPDGTFERFKVVEAPIMNAELQAQHPNIKTFLGQGMDDPYATLRCDWTDFGFRAQVLTPFGSWYIDPYTFGDTSHYASYFRRDYVSDAHFQCSTTGEPIPTPDSVFQDRVPITRRQYRLALSCTGEYAAFFGGTAPLAEAAMTTAINRVTGVYESELGIRLLLVDFNTYTNGGTDPFTNNSGSTMLNENQTVCNASPGSANYDIGHVFSTGGGGIAQLGCVCSAGNKAKGVTGSSSPVGDAFTIDYVAHEMGHQFNAPHTFAYCGGANGSYEPGSGSTIMAYAGICGADDLQAHSDPYFLHSSIDTIKSFIAGVGACSSNTATSNEPPTVVGTSNRSIPEQTAFYLTGSGADANGDPLTFSWEERDAGSLPLASLPTAASGSIFRPLVPKTVPTRYFPALDDVFDGSTDIGEYYPNPAANRNLNFRLSARDNVAGNGGTTNTTSDTTVTVVASAGPFTVTAPNTAVSLTGGATTTVTWNVANTTAAPISTANVSIALTTDAGTNWTVLLASTPNDGSEVVTLPNITTSTARIKVEAVGNTYFDVSNANFSIAGATIPPNPFNTGSTPSTICSGNTSSLSTLISAGTVADWYTVSCGGTFVGTGNPLVVSPTVTTQYFVRARRTSDNAVSAGCGTTTVTVTPGPTAPTGANVDRDTFCSTDAGQITLTATGGSGTTLSWYSGSCGGTLEGTGSPLVIDSPSVSTTYFARWSSSCGTSTCASVSVAVGGGDLDFNNDTLFPDTADIDDLLSVFSGGPCSNDPNCDTIDFNGDGLFPDTADIDAFLAVFSGGSC